MAAVSRTYGRLGVAVALALLAGGAAPAWAQEAPRPTEAELVEALDALMPALRRAQAEVDSAQAAQRARELAGQAPLDTLRIGGAVVVVPRGEGEAARDVVGVLWEEEYAPWAGDAPRLERGPWMAFQWDAEPVDIRVPGRNLVEVEGAPWRPRSYMRDGARQAVGARFTSQLQETRLGLWLSGVPLRVPPDGTAAYRRVATAASAPARACLEGDLGGCATALSLEMDETPVDEWYTPGERRLLVLRNAPLWSWNAESRAVLRRCQEGVGGACGEALELYRTVRQMEGRTGLTSEVSYWGAPLADWVRATFLWVALQEGDPGTWERLVEAADRAPLEAVTYATGRPAEELLAAWRAWLLEQRPRKENTAGTHTLNALFWAALFLIFATRSTRWRLG